MQEKAGLRKTLRATRREHVAAQSPSIRSLLFNRPPAPLLDMVDAGAVIGLYHATGNEAPTASYAKFFYERGHRVALPRFASFKSAMSFAEFTDPFGESDLVDGAFGLKQPDTSAEVRVPDVLFVPVIGFTAQGGRLGQGGGHYDRWLAEHVGKTAIGLAWDVQLVEDLPEESHDHPLNAVVTPTRLYGPFG